MELAILMLFMAGGAFASIGIREDLGIDIVENEERPFAPPPPSGSDGDDEIAGTIGLDELYGHAGDDVLDGHDGDDTLNGGTGSDMLFGGPGDDWITVEADLNTLPNILYGGSGADVLMGSSDIDLIFAGGFEVSMDLASDLSNLVAYATTDQHADMINAGAGDDILVFSGGDRVSGGADTDAFYVEFIDLIVEAGTPAVIADFAPASETLSLVDADGDVSWVADGDDMVVRVDGAPVVILQGVASTFGAPNLASTTFGRSGIS